MKYKCFVPFIVILSFVAMGVRVSAADSASHTTTISARIAPVIEVVSWPDSLIEIPDDIIPGVPQVLGPLTVEVRSNCPWVLNVRSAIPGGKLTQFDRVALKYVSSGSQMSTPVQWGVHPSGPWTNLSNDQIPASGGPPTGEAGAKTNLYLKIEATFDDPVLVEPDHEYRMDVSYIVSVTY